MGFYKPRYHWELVEWFNKKYGPEAANYRAWSFDRLYAAYMRIRLAERAPRDHESVGV